jgi:hypothetical protein
VWLVVALSPVPLALRCAGPRADARLGLDGQCLRAKCEADHDLGYALMQRFAQVVVQRLQATRLQLLDLYGVHA